MPPKRPRPKTISLVLADVDGTLVTKDKALTTRALAAVDALRDRGILFAITSGRPPRGMAMLIGPLGLTTPIAGFNGGSFVNPDLTIRESRTLKVEAARKASAIMAAAGLDVWVYHDDRWMIRDPTAPHAAREEHTVAFPPHIVADLDSFMDGAVKIVGVSDDLAKVAATEQAVKAALGSSAFAARSQPYYLDVTNPDANKGAVVDYLAKALGVSAAETATIGDMPNDVTMFTRSGFSIAMGQASDAVKAQADAVTDGNEDDGFAKAIERLILQPYVPFVTQSS